MHNETPHIPVYYAPFWTAGGVTTREESENAAARWLLDYPIGEHQEPWVFAPNKRNYEESDLGRALSQYRVNVTTDRSGTMGRGPVLAPWADRASVEKVWDSRAAAICVIGWGDPKWFDSLMAACDAMNVVTGEPHQDSGKPRLDPVVRTAMIELEWRVNHANALAGVHDKADAIETFAALREGRAKWDTDSLWAWALANGFSGAEGSRLRDYSDRALARKRFQKEPSPTRLQECFQRWEVPSG